MSSDAAHQALNYIPYDKMGVHIARYGVSGSREPLFAIATCTPRAARGKTVVRRNAEAGFFDMSSALCAAGLKEVPLCLGNVMAEEQSAKFCRTYCE